MKFEMKVIIQDGIDFLARYVYYIDGGCWEDVFNYRTIIKKGAALKGAGTSTGYNENTVPVEMRT